MINPARSFDPSNTHAHETSNVFVQRAVRQDAPIHEIPASVSETIRGPGQPLDTETRVFMESRFEHDFSNVRVHTDAQANESAQAVNALAYTVGREVVFGSGQYQPGTNAGRKLLAHELTHVVQQRGNMTQRGATPTAITETGEREAQATSREISAGGRMIDTLTALPLSIQRQPQGEAEKKPPEKKDGGETVAEGVKTVAEQAADNERVKKVIIEPMKAQAKGRWNQLSAGEKAGVIGAGAGMLGMTGGAMLSDPQGRKQLEGVNLAAPLTLIPYMPLTSFKYTLPGGEGGDKRLFRFETGFNADEIINLRTQARGLPKMALSLNLQWGYDPTTDRLSVLGGNATLGLVPGLSISGGAYKDILRPSPTFAGAEGQTITSKQSLPETGKPQAIPDVRFMINVDLLKFKPGDLAKQIGSWF